MKRATKPKRLRRSKRPARPPGKRRQTTVKTQQQATAFVRRHGLVLLSGKNERVPSLAQAVAGKPIAGSWWGHPKGKLIFHLATQLMEGPDVLALKLVAGKVTLVHRALWPQLLRVVLDPAWRAVRIKHLDAAARRLLTRLDSGGQLTGGPAGAVLQIEHAQLAWVISTHTEQGHHQKQLVAWSRWQADVGARATPESLSEALARLSRAARGAPLF